MTETPADRYRRARALQAQVRRQNRRTLLFLLLASLAMIGLLVAAIAREDVTAEWRRIQQQYGEILEAKATDDWGRTLAAGYRTQMAQIVVPALNVTDRCITCHRGIDDPRMADQPAPFGFHPGRMHAWHEPEKFGCTVCHQGQGRAVTHAAAHGQVPHWDYPLLARERVYTRCSLCHYENDLFGAAEDTHAPRDRYEPITRRELEAVVPGLESPRSLAVVRGKQLVQQLGCLGCHKVRGRGGTLGPDISYVGDKTVHDFDFSHVHVTGQRTVDQWLYAHFLRPAEVSPATVMPDYGLTEDQARDLTVYMRSLHRKVMPADYTPTPAVDPAAPPATGSQLYRLFCAGCHGPDGQGSTVREATGQVAAGVRPPIMVPSLNNPDTLAVVSDGYLRQIITEGREETAMIGWGPGHLGNLHADEVERLVAAIRAWQTPAPNLAAIGADRGDARVGATLYRANCAACHGDDGQGGIGTRLNSPSFLAIASDAFLARTLIHGRADTAMPAWSQFGPQRLSDLLAFLRTWQAPRNTRRQTLQQVAAAREGRTQDASVAIGRILYRSHCLTCHGPEGAGDLGPSLAAPEFLSLVDPGYLYDVLRHGRSGTGMPAWRHLSDADLASLILLIESWRQGEHQTSAPAVIPGDWDAGRILFAQACASCHGPEGEGAVGPQLANPEFLAVVTDGMLQQWIAHGKTGTAMRGFLRGGQGVVDFSVQQINNLVAYLRSLERREDRPVARYASGRPGLGRLWFVTYCAGCHGENGEGASGPALTNGDFLAAASSGFLTATLALGRDGTEMRPVKAGPDSILSLDSDQINDLVAYLRQCETTPPVAGVAHHYVIPWNLAHGRALYESHCAGCHGIDGKAEHDEPGRVSAWAPALNNQSFLRAATDGFLQATIARGRDGTSMRAFGHGRQGLVDLSPDDIDDIVAYIRRWSTQTGLPMTLPAQRQTFSQPVSETAQTSE